MNDRKLQVKLSPDADGFIGRECPECEAYFKVKFGTGLDIDFHRCPYCRHSASVREFFTKAQLEYIESIVIREIVGPGLRDLQDSFKKLESSSKGGLFSIKVKTTDFRLPIKRYQEQILETSVICENCNLEFAIFGVFSDCPDCGRLNSMTIFRKSIETCKKRLVLSDMNEGISTDLVEDALLGAVAAFDAMGKALREKFPGIFPTRPKNLFQNLLALKDALENNANISITDVVSISSWNLIFKMFQVRHLLEHNLGVVDHDFVEKIPEYRILLGKRFPVEKEEIATFLDEMISFTEKIHDLLD